MSDNVIEFPSGKSGDGASSMSADDALELCKGRFDEVIIIGIKDDNGQCVSTVSIVEAIYELSRAMHILHNYIDRM